MEKHNPKRFYHNLGIILTAVLLCVLVINLALPKKSFSEKENRVLASFPSFSMSGFTGGRLETQIEDYANDHFMLRDLWVSFRSNFNRLLGKSEQNGVYLGKDGYLLESFAMPDDSFTAGVSDALSAFAMGHSSLNMYMLLAPTSVNILKDHLPAFAPEADQDHYIDTIRTNVTNAGMRFVDVRDTFRSRPDEQLYYRTDHHWTTLGAYYAYNLLAQEMQFDASLVTYEKLPASTRFQGTLAAKSGFRQNLYDELDVFLPADATSYEYVVTYVDDRKKVASFYASEKLATRDKYAMFFDGNHAQVRIYTPEADDRTLLVIKDSYANSLVPFLSPNYRNIIMIDPRYYYGALDDLIAADEVDDVLFLYNAKTFFSDNSLELLLAP